MQLCASLLMHQTNANIRRPELARKGGENSQDPIVILIGVLLFIEPCHLLSLRHPGCEAGMTVEQLESVDVLKADDICVANFLLDLHQTNEIS